jgi:hypothetical protein
LWVLVLVYSPRSVLSQANETSARTEFRALTQFRMAVRPLGLRNVVVT